MASCSLRAVSKSFGDIVALDQVQFTIQDGEFLVVLGPTGAGKSTLLRSIAGLTEIDAGEIYINGRDVATQSCAQRDVALVFQQYSLYPRLTVRENIAFPLRAPGRKLSEDAIAARVAEVAKILKIEHRLDANTQTLSGGEMQRVSIGRAIVRSPQLFLMDEPLSNLDAKLREAMRSQLRSLHRELGATIVFVTHDQVEALSLGDRIAILDRGRIVQIGTADEIYNQPANTFVAELVGSPTINLIPLQRIHRYLCGAADWPSQVAITVGIRPENITLSEGGDFVVENCENLGAEQILTMSAQGLRLRVVNGARHYPTDRQYTLSIDARNCLQFDAQGIALTTT